MQVSVTRNKLRFQTSWAYRRKISRIKEEKRDQICTEIYKLRILATSEEAHYLSTKYEKLKSFIQPEEHLRCEEDQQQQQRQRRRRGRSEENEFGRVCGDCETGFGSGEVKSCEIIQREAEGTRHEIVRISEKHSGNSGSTDDTDSFSQLPNFSVSDEDDGTGQSGSIDGTFVRKGISINTFVGPSGPSMAYGNGNFTTSGRSQECRKRSPHRSIGWGCQHRGNPSSDQRDIQEMSRQGNMEDLVVDVCHRKSSSRFIRTSSESPQGRASSRNAHALLEAGRNMQKALREVHSDYQPTGSVIDETISESRSKEDIRSNERFCEDDSSPSHYIFCTQSGHSTAIRQRIQRFGHHVRSDGTYNKRGLAFVQSVLSAKGVPPGPAGRPRNVEIFAKPCSYKATEMSGVGAAENEIFEMVESAKSEVQVDVNFVLSSSESTHTSFFMDGSWHVMRSRKARCELPIAAVTRPDFDYAQLERCFAEVTPDAQLIEMFSWMTTNKLALRLIQRLEAIDVLHAGGSSHLNQSLDQLLEADTISLGSSIMCSKVFTVEKSDGMTSRFVFDGRLFDEVFHAEMGKTPPMHIPDIQNIIEILLQPKWKLLAMNDGKNMFFQYRTHRDLSKFFGFEARGCKYRMNALPMGICFAPAWTQMVSNYILQLTRHRSIHQEWVAFAWVDNFIFAAVSQENMDSAMSSFETVCRELNLVLKGWEIGSTLKILGMKFTTGSTSSIPCVTITSDALVKLERAWHQLSTRAATARTFIVWFGHIMWNAYTISKVPMCFFPCTMGQLRKICSTQDWDAAFDINDLSDEPSYLNRMASTTIRYARRELQIDSFVFTDSSTTNMAAVSSGGEAWTIPISTTSGNIYITELLAAVTASIDMPRIENWMWLCDNYAVVQTFVKGHSTCKIGDQLLRWWIASRRCPASVTWVKSENNLSDVFSRICCLQTKEIEFMFSETIGGHRQLTRWHIPDTVELPS